VHQHKAGGLGARSNAYLVEGATGIVAVDALLTVSEARALRATLEALRKPLVALVITHGHPDHCGGVAEMVGPEDVPVLAVGSVDTAIRSDFAAKAERLRQTLGEEWSPKRAYPTRLLTDGEAMSFDDLTLTAHEVGPGESQSDSYWIIDGPGSRLAFIGDIVMNRVHGYLAEGHSGAWLRNLERVRRELAEVPVLYPGHGEAGDPEMFDWERGYLEAYRDAARSLAAGRPALTDEQKQELQRRMLAFLPDDKLTEFILRSSDAVAAELAAES
jgi:glyoxylase-like metal-dependent hydrolase (beta-lactamase superfamily II)